LRGFSIFDSRKSILKLVETRSHFQAFTIYQENNVDLLSFKLLRGLLFVIA
jgi:hypothetical protein